MNNAKNKAAVFILLGQSNAVGDSTPMTEEDKITKPMKNVFGLHRNPNQTFDSESLVWSGYMSSGMNLAEEQDHTYSLANCLADLWQNEIDNGNKNLPDLYIIQIAIGAQGITNGYMWNPEYEKTLIPGKLGEVKISLFSFTQHILSMLSDSLKDCGITDVKYALHWRGGENDTSVTQEELCLSLKNTYNQLFDMFYNSIGQKVPLTLHKHLCFDRCTQLFPENMWQEKRARLHYINQVFEELCEENKNIEIFDASKAPHYIPDVPGNGIFIDDWVHYNSETNYWVAKEIMKGFQKD